MNIYSVGWVQDENFGLSAVVIAASENEALEELDLDGSYNSEIRAYLIGVCTDGTRVRQTVCRESI